MQRTPKKCLTTASALLVTSIALGAAPRTADLRQLSHEADALLGLTKSMVAVVDVTLVEPQHIVAAVRLPSGTVLLDLYQQSVRAPGFQVVAQLDDGSYQANSPGPVNTYRGEVVGVSDSKVAGSWLDEGLFARVMLDHAEDLWIQPLGALLDDASPAHHVIYRSEDVIPGDRGCGAELLAPLPPSLSANPTGANQTYGTNDPIAELACDADFEYFQRYGTVSATQNRIESVIGTMNLQYESQVDITHTITTIIVRTTSNDPYSSTDPVTLLNQFRNHWNSSQGGVQRDVAHLFTGKNVDGGTIGIAWVGVVCNASYGYGLVESDFNNNFSCATDLSAHELGHNWNAPHCSCTSNTMNPFITCANSFHPTITVPTIVNYRNAVSCLDSGGPGGGPTSVHVASIVPGTSVGGGNRVKAQVTVTIQNDQGGPVSGASVTVQVSGDISDSMTGTTGANGSVTLTSKKAKKNSLSYTGCVTNVSASLPYNAGANVETCDSN